ncbi:MAG: formate dehydrogenase accessory sulfurtransferase FdhD [Myxococcota bacterium]|nr:formate dehydrogenase accessory sulfurtransferase FdhD [Myxococcota bacterium]
MLDDVVVEEPLEIRVDGQALAVLMRTPGHDAQLTAGFLLTEGVIDVPDDLQSLGPCTDPNRPNAGNVFLAQLAPGCPDATERLAAAQRQFYASSSCGLCGKATIESIHQRVRPHAAFRDLPHALLAATGDRARGAQDLFAPTGGCHGALAFSLGEDASILASAEDVGRHNAVDKVVGALLLDDALPEADAILWVSGRASFEMVQKALMAGFAALVCVGAPTSLAVEMARESRLTLVGFATGPERYNVYAGSVVDT